MDKEMRKRYLKTSLKAFVTIGVLVTLIGLAAQSTCRGDTIYLMNGRAFYGKVTEHTEAVKDKDGNPNEDARLYRVFFGSTDRHSDEYKGFIDIQKKDVEKVEINDLDAFKDNNFPLF